MSRTHHNPYFDRTKSDKLFEKLQRKRIRRNERCQLKSDNPQFDPERKTKFSNKK